MNSSGTNVYDYYWYENYSKISQQDLETIDVLKNVWDSGKLEIPLYAIIFLLAVVGNILVILTLVQNGRMRTNTNVFLLNLAVADLVLAVLCMPFTLIGTLLRDFVFGESMCKLVPFLQATSVAASVWTLVALSIERYYAICHPLRSRRWQTLSHAYHLIGFIWAGGALFMLPIPVLSELQPTNKGHHKCRERWPSGNYERAYNLFLDVLLLLVPLLVLAVTYYLIAITLWQDLSNKSAHVKQQLHRESNGSLQNEPSQSKTKAQDKEMTINTNNDPFDDSTIIRSISTDTYREIPNLKSQYSFVYRQFGNHFSLLNCLKINQKNENGESDAGEISSVRNTLQSYSMQGGKEIVRLREDSADDVQEVQKLTSVINSPQEIGLRHTNYERSLNNKQRVIKMIFVVVLEFFICWTPLYVINTLALFWPQLIYETIGYKTITFCQLLAYTSSCCNPITYCFMNKGFRTSFIDLFDCCKSK